MLKKRNTRYYNMIFLSAAVGATAIVIGTVLWAKTGLVIFAFIQLAGTIVFLEGILFITGIHAHWRKRSNYLKHILSLVLLGSATGVLLFDVVGLLIFRIWEYPVYSPFSNLLGYLSVVLLWGAYFLIFHQTYLLLHHLLHHSHRHAPANNKLKTIFKYVGPLGIVLVLTSAGFSKMTETSLFFAAVMAIGVWFILEGFEFPRKRLTILYEMISGNFRPLFSIFIGAFVVGFLSEWTNLAAPIQQWIYFGIPWEHINLFGVPISLLLAWSIMYIIFLSLENILLKADEKIWD